MKSALKKLLVIGGVCAAVLAPWIVRNAVVFHRFIFIKQAMGLNLWQGNHPGASGALYDRDGVDIMSNLTPEERARLAQMDETEMDRWFLARSLHFIKTHPAAFARLYLVRLANFYNPFPPAHFNYTGEGRATGRFHAVRALCYALLFFAFLAGWILTRWVVRRPDPLILVILTPAFCFAIFHLDNHRYRFVYENLMLAYAAVTVDYLIGWITNKHSLARF